MIQIPVIDDVLVVPGDLARVRVQRERGIVVEVLVLIPAQGEFRRRYRNGRADIDQIQLRVITRHHPCSDVPALFHGYSSPRLIAGFTGLGNGAGTPQFLAGLRVMRCDDATFMARAWLALTAGYDLAVCNDGA